MTEPHRLTLDMSDLPDPTLYLRFILPQLWPVSHAESLMELMIFDFPQSLLKQSKPLGGLEKDK